MDRLARIWTGCDKEGILEPTVDNCQKSGDVGSFMGKGKTVPQDGDLKWVGVQPERELKTLPWTANKRPQPTALSS